MLTPPAAIEALLFANGEPMEKSDLAALLAIHEDDLEVALRALSDSYKGRGFALIDTGKEVELRTAPDAQEFVKKLRESELSRDLGKAGLETLATIAYRGSATRGEVDWVRGVNSSASVRTLLLRGLIEGEEDPADKRRIRYHLTTDALAHLGVKSLSELPRYGELKEGADAVVATAEAEQTAP